MSDLALKIDQGCIDLSLSSDGSSLLRDDGLETAVLISLFTDQHVSASEIPTGLNEQRGWWGDLVTDAPGDQIGSKLWTLARESVSLQTVAAVQTRAKQALQWMIDDGVADSVEVTAKIASQNGIEFSVTITQSSESNLYSFLWQGQKLKVA